MAKPLMWVRIAQELQSIAQCGITYCKNPFDLERYHQLNTLAAEIISNHSEYSMDEVKGILYQEKGYQTPKLDVRAAVFHENKVLMVQESADNLWTLPGGWCDINESASESVVREVYEESGYQVKVTQLAALWDKQKHNHPAQLPHAYKAMFICELIGGEPKVSHETLAVDWFARDKLPPMSLHRTLPEQVEKLYQHYDSGCLQTAFD